MRYKRLIPFIYSSSIAYLVEVGDYYMRFYYDDELITAIETPYPEAYIFKLQYQQIADVMRVALAQYHQKKLTRTSATTFTLTDIDFRTGPFLTRNDLIDPDILNPTEMSCSATLKGSYGILSADAPYFDSGHAGALFKLIHQVATPSVSLDGAGTSAAVYIDKNGGYFSTQGTWTGTIKLQKSENNSDWDDYKTYTALSSGARNDAYTIKEADGPGYFRLNNSDASCKSTLTTWDILAEGIVRVISVSNSKTATCLLLANLGSTAKTPRWAEGSWSEYRGFPSTITFFENRCCYAGGISNSDKSEGEIPGYPSLRNIT